ncbi:hypothetical protein NKR23_g6748 [Pleurostoma richardsiae]|uniref:Flavin reductase like domain-containing protein n=1 Tax=Pleurostoma richardsiae TaxID=41990 RepID=A0AA38RXQ2_9PEZI|nr:hypothetical protein NKR23_g6748 [Pleurostoma richardsiae]
MSPATANSLGDALPIEAVDKEALINRNPYEDFEAAQASRPGYRYNDAWALSKAPDTEWKVGGGASSEDWKAHSLISIDPFEEGRAPVMNYKLMISTTVPRPIALVSTRTADGKTNNLAPISYFQNVVADPPLYSLSLTGKQQNDTLRNVLATGELCISMTSDWIVEAANMASVNTPPHISEWELTGLTPLAGEVQGFGRADRNARSR